MQQKRVEEFGFFSDDPAVDEHGLFTLWPARSYRRVF